MSKRGQGISLNVIIIAAIALLVLVILSIIFIGRMGGWRTQLDDCAQNGGKCIDAGVSCGEGAAADYPTEYQAWSAGCGEDKKCCIKL
ncbi:MAG: hypothetical protein ABH879_09300 [archaeon]